MVCRLPLIFPPALLLFFAVSVNGQGLDLVVNGEFENPDVVGVDPALPPGIEIRTDVPGWQSSSGEFEIWDQGILFSPTAGADALGTGQHLELNAVASLTEAILFQEFVIPNNFGSSATLGFDSWFRFPSTDFYRVTGSLSGELVAETQITESSDFWLRTEETFAVLAGELIRIEFISGVGNNVDGAHLDQISFTASDAPSVPEPSSLLLLVTSMLCALIRRRESDCTS